MPPRADARSLLVALLIGFSATGDRPTTLATFSAITTSPGNTLAVLEVQPAVASAPLSLAAGIVRVGWAASPTAATESVTYALLRRPSGSPTYAQVASSAALWLDDAPPADGIYDYVVRSVVGALWRDGASVTGRSDATPPTAAAALSAASGTVNGSIDLTWTAATDAGSGVSGYTIRYVQAAACPAPSTSAYPSSTAVGAVTTATVGGLLRGRPYCLYLVTSDAAGNVSVPSAVASAKAK